MIVVDTNVIAYLLITGTQTEAARAVLMTDAAWAAPVLWRSEFRNVLALYLRRHSLSLPDAVELQVAAEEVLAGREFTVESSSVLRLAAESSCSAYDCEFVTLARTLDVPFVTSDRQLLAAFPDTAVALSAFKGGS